MPNHSRDGPVNFLANFRGYLQADAYKGYEVLYQRGAIIEVACWAHTRRYFYEARDGDPPRAHQALAFIRQLYTVEEQGRTLDAGARAALRQEQARLILDAFHAWLGEQTTAAENPVLPKSPLGQALAYARTNWEALVRYTSDGDLAIDNNAAERALRAVVTGRKNWLFAGSDAGGRTAAILYSFTSTCQRHKLDSFAYLRDLFTRLPTHPAERLAELLPDCCHHLLVLSGLKWLTSVGSHSHVGATGPGRGGGARAAPGAGILPGVLDRVRRVRGGLLAGPSLRGAVYGRAGPLACSDKGRIGGRRSICMD
jgi:transposase